MGLGPFAGVLGVALHSAGSIAKLWPEAIETIEPGPLEAVAMTGAGRLKIVFYALLPDVLPALLSTSLYIWEFNIRSSTVLGLVGAGGIGQDLKHAVDLLDFSSVATIILIILGMVTAVDQLSAWLRRRLTAAIEAIGLSKNYAGKAVLSDVSFRIEPGEVVTLLGPSGAGKTTLFSCLTQLAVPDRGRILWFGRAVTEMRRRESHAAISG